MEKQLIHEINNIKYLLFQVPVLSHSKYEKLLPIIKKYNGIMQAVTDINLDFFGAVKCCIVWVLIPEAHVMDFNNEEL